MLALRLREHEAERTEEKQLSDSIQTAFEEIASAMVTAAGERRIDAAESAVERHGLAKQGDGTPSQITVWEKSDESQTLRFQWRWYDQSQAFSIRPDMNILTLELRNGDRVVRQAEQRYED